MDNETEKLLIETIESIELEEDNRLYVPMVLERIAHDAYFESLCSLPPAAQSSLGYLNGEPVRFNSKGDRLFNSYFEIGEEFFRGPLLTIAQFKRVKQ